MKTMIRAVFDGQVFRPVEPVELEPNATYTISIEDAEVADDDDHPLTAIRQLATDMGVTDLSENHDWYAQQRVTDSQNDA